MIPGLEQYRQFIAWTLRGKDKLPVNPKTLQVGDAHDPAIWTDYATAKAAADLAGYGVGFVFTANDPFFFLDIDKAWDGQQWSATARQLCETLAGCAVEISQSGTGLHIFGTGIAPGAHGCKNLPAGLELYTAGRFAALTGHGVQGDARHTPGPEVCQWLVDGYFPGTPLQTGDAADWSDGPTPEYSGPADDEELLARMLRSKSAGALLGGKASIKQLWEADADALAVAFPPLGDGPFDHSSADAALCAHLAFWTGKDCARIDRLFRRSALVRDKWTEREDYSRRTILNAAARCRQVLGGNRPQQQQQQQPEGPDDEMIGYQFAGIDQQRGIFAGCVYIRDLHRVYVPDGGLLKQEQFKAVYGGRVFALDAANDKTTRNAWEAFTESQAVRFPKVHAACFRPELPPGEVVQEEGHRLVNTYVPAPTARQQGDPGRFLRHLEKMLPNATDRLILLSYMSATVQHVGVKFQWCPLIQGAPGNGKTILSNVLAHAVGWRYVHLPNANDLSNKFNAWILGRVFIGVEEIYVQDRREAIDALKPLITNPKIEVQGKGDNQVVGDNRANFMMFSNHKDAIKKTRQDRRYCVFYTAQQTEGDVFRDMGGDYFPDFYDWLRAEGYAIINDYLRRFEIPAEFNPAGKCHRAPKTSSTAEALELSRGGLEQEIIEAAGEGRYGFSRGWISSKAFADLLSERKDEKRIPPNKRREILRDLGYIPHPGLPDGRVNNAIPREGGKPRLYIHELNPATGVSGAAEIVKKYLEDQA